MEFKEGYGEVQEEGRGEEMGEERDEKYCVAYYFVQLDYIEVGHPHEIREHLDLPCWNNILRYDPSHYKQTPGLIC